MMDNDLELAPPRNWPLVVALLASLLWLVLAVLAFAPAFPGMAPSPRLAAIARPASMALMLGAPLALVWMVANQLRERVGARAARAALMEQQARFTEIKLDQGVATLVLLEDRMTALAMRIEAVGTPVEIQHQALLAATSRLETTGARLTDASGRAEQATVTLDAATPAAIAQAENLVDLLGRSHDDLQMQLAQTETLLASLWSRARDAETQAQAAAERTTSGLDAITEAAGRTVAAVGVPLALLTEGVDAAFVRTTAAMDSTRDGVHAQTNAMLASVDQARVTLDHIGGEAERQIKARLESLLTAANKLGGELETHAERSNALIEDVARGFTILDAKLGNSATTGNAALESIAVRMTEAREAIHRLGDPIAATDTALAVVESRLGDIGAAVGETLGSLGTALPAAMPHLDNMAVRLSELHDRADQLSLPLTAGGDSIANAQAQLDNARAALDSAAVALGAELTTARGALADIETMTGNASLAASSQLIEVFGRVRDIANQTAGTMRETLSNVVAEAEAALDQAGRSRAELAFGVPIRAQLAEVETMHNRVAAAGQAAAERITRRLLALTESVAAVEAHIDETDTRFEVRARSTLAKRSGALIDSMQANAIDIAALLSFQIEDTAWDSYLKGDRSIFARRIVEQLDNNTTRAIGRHFQHDPEFRTQATHYIDEFETLISQVMPDRDGRSLAVTLLSSNIGKLYVALGQAVGRFK